MAGPCPIPATPDPPEETFPMTEEELGERQQHSMVAGEHAAYQHAVKILQDAAGHMFVIGKDEQARGIRELANQMEKFKDDASRRLQEHIKKSIDLGKAFEGKRRINAR